VEAAVRITPCLPRIVSGEPAADVAEAMNGLAQHGYESVAADR
jgi:hypothetical protein